MQFSVTIYTGQGDSIIERFDIVEVVEHGMGVISGYTLVKILRQDGFQKWVHAGNVTTFELK